MPLTIGTQNDSNNNIYNDTTHRYQQLKWKDSTINPFAGIVKIVIYGKDRQTHYSLGKGTSSGGGSSKVPPTRQQQKICKALTKQTNQGRTIAKIW